jgi:tRNA threonylcarbamoyladenosine biosynthesis protein TsaE
LEGPLGAGKTTLVKGIAESLEIREPITSPTFTIVSEYQGRLPLYHIDLYRVGSSEEIELLGLEELIYGSGVSVVEWSDKAPGLFVDPIRVSLRITGADSRVIQVSGAMESLLP